MLADKRSQKSPNLNKNENFVRESKTNKFALSVVKRIQTWMLGMNRIPSNGAPATKWELK
jgi:hypothetical protein